MSVVIDGHLFTDVGQMTGANGASGPQAGSTIVGAWAHKNSSEPYLYDVGASAVPATALIVNNVAFTSAGVLYVTTVSPSATDMQVSCLRVRQDGAVRVATAAVLASDITSGGWAMKQTGEARVSIT